MIKSCVSPSKSKVVLIKSYVGDTKHHVGVNEVQRRSY